MSTYFIDASLTVSPTYADVRSTIDGELIVCFNNRLWRYLKQWLNEEETLALLVSLTSDRALVFGHIVWEAINAS